VPLFERCEREQYHLMINNVAVAGAPCSAQPSIASSEVAGTAGSGHGRMGRRRVGGPILHGARLCALLRVLATGGATNLLLVTLLMPVGAVFSWNGHSPRENSHRRLHRHGPDRTRPHGARWPTVGAVQAASVVRSR
jgi:hypothetical protein